MVSPGKVMCNYVEEVRHEVVQDARQSKPWHANARMAAQVRGPHDATLDHIMAALTHTTQRAAPWVIRP